MMGDNTIYKTKPAGDPTADVEDANEPMKSRDYGAQGANGYDLCTFRANLRLTPTERIEKLNRALNVYFEVKRAGEKYRLSRGNTSSR